MSGKGKLDKYTQLRWFLQGLPPPIQSELFNHYNIDLDGDAVPDFEGILKKAYSLIETRKKMVELDTTDIKNDRMSDLVNRSAKKTQLDHPFFGPSTLSDSVFQVPIVLAAPLITTPPFQNDKKIDNLTDEIRSLALSIRTLQGSTNAPLVTSQSELQPTHIPSESRMRTNYRETGPGKSWPEGVNRCMYYWQTDYYLKRHCQVFQDNPNFSRIHLGDKGRVYLGAYLSGARPVFMRREKPGRKSVADAEKLRYPTVSAAKVHTIRIDEVQPDPYFFDDEDDYVSLDALLDVTVSAAQSSQKKSNGVATKEPIKRILRKRIEKKDGYAAPKNVRFGEASTFFLA